MWIKVICLCAGVPNATLRYLKTHIKLSTCSYLPALPSPHAGPVLHASPWVLIKVWQAHSAVVKNKVNLITVWKVAGSSAPESKWVHIEWYNARWKIHVESVRRSKTTSEINLLECLKCLMGRRTPRAKLSRAIRAAKHAHSQKIHSHSQ